MKWLRVEETSFAVTSRRRQAPRHSNSQNRHISSCDLIKLYIHLTPGFAQTEKQKNPKNLLVLTTLLLWRYLVLATVNHSLSTATSHIEFPLSSKITTAYLLYLLSYKNTKTCIQPHRNQIHIRHTVPMSFTRLQVTTPILVSWLSVQSSVLPSRFLNAQFLLKSWQRYKNVTPAPVSLNIQWGLSEVFIPNPGSREPGRTTVVLLCPKIYLSLLRHNILWHKGTPWCKHNL